MVCFKEKMKARFYLTKLACCTEIKKTAANQRSLQVHSPFNLVEHFLIPGYKHNFNPSQKFAGFGPWDVLGFLLCREPQTLVRGGSAILKAF